jgi:two-component system response regulator AlgR
MESRRCAVHEPSEVRVLIVDDQEPYRRAMSAVVDATDGFVVVGSATSGEESLAVAAELRPDLVLMDINLPGIDGIEAGRRLASGTDGPVVVLLSTYDEDQFELDGCGAAAYVAKAAFGPDRLSAAWADAGRALGDR